MNRLAPLLALVILSGGHSSIAADLEATPTVVGADESEIRREIRKAVSRSPIDSQLRILGLSAQGVLRLEVSASSRSGAPNATILGMLALFQDGLVTPVSRGENARRTLDNERVVRELRTVLELTPDTTATVTKIVELPLDGRWPTEDLGVVLFLQNPHSMEILDATSLRLPPTSAP